MPGMDGVTCAEKILDRDPSANIIMISGYDKESPEGIDPQINNVTKGYITKPIDKVRLSLMLDQLLGESSPSL
jgi:YesN/AraC family two-component response regulator